MPNQRSGFRTASSVGSSPALHTRPPALRCTLWRYPVIIDLAGLSIPSQARPIRFGHDPLSGVGHTDAIRVEGGQLIATGIVSRDTPAAREVVVSSKNGFPWQASVGAGVDEFEFVKEGQKVTVNGTQYSGPVNVVRKSSLGEISFVDLGADGATSASVAAQASATPGGPDMDDSQTQTQDDPNAAPVAPVAPSPATPEPVTTQLKRQRSVMILAIVAGLFSYFTQCFQG